MSLVGFPHLPLYEHNKLSLFLLDIIHCIKDIFVMILALGYLEMYYSWNISNILFLLTNLQSYLQVFYLPLIFQDQKQLTMVIFQSLLKCISQGERLTSASV